MVDSGHALRLTILIGEDDAWRHKPLHHEIVERARAARLAGATVLRGCEGFGRSSLVHTDRLLSLAEDLPVMVIIIDAEPPIRAFLAEAGRNWPPRVTPSVLGGGAAAAGLAASAGLAAGFSGLLSAFSAG